MLQNAPHLTLLENLFLTGIDGIKYKRVFFSLCFHKTTYKFFEVRKLNARFDLTFLLGQRARRIRIIHLVPLQAF